MEHPCVSVLMVNYNQEELIAQSIECVLNQTYKNLQFIIVDDGSTDSSREIIRAYAQKDSRIEPYYMEQNLHISYATNYGFSKVKGEYLARIDSDDLWDLEKLERQLSFMNHTDNCQICFTGTDLIDETGQLINEREDSHFLYELLNQPGISQPELLSYFFTEGNRFTHSSVLMKTQIMQETGNFHLAYRQLHDFDYWVRIAKRHPLFFLEDKLTKLRRFVHSEKKNTSSQSQTDTIRFYNEYMMIRETFFDDMEDSLFQNAFGLKFRKKNACSKEELECEKAFLLLDGFRINGKKQPVLGLKRLARLFDRPDTAQVLLETYHYKPSDYYQENSVSLFYDPFTQDAVLNIEKILQDNHLLFQEIQKLKEEKMQALKHGEQLEKQLNELNHMLTETQKALEIITHSTSWKITGPIRKVLDYFRSR